MHKNNVQTGNNVSCFPLSTPLQFAEHVILGFILVHTPMFPLLHCTYAGDDTAADNEHGTDKNGDDDDDGIEDECDKHDEKQYDHNE